MLQAMDVKLPRCLRLHLDYSLRFPFRYSINVRLPLWVRSQLTFFVFLLFELHTFSNLQHPPLRPFGCFWAASIQERKRKKDSQTSIKTNHPVGGSSPQTPRSPRVFGRFLSANGFNLNGKGKKVKKASIQILRSAWTLPPLHLRSGQARKG